MLGSLRVRLPLVFLAGILIAGLITTAISVRLFQQFAHDQALTKLSREAHGIAQLYSPAIELRTTRRTRRAPTTFDAETLEQATGDKIYFVGPKRLFPGQIAGLHRLPLKTIDWTSGRSLTFELKPPGGAANVPRGCQPDLPHEAGDDHADRRDRRRDAEDRRQPQRRCADRAAGDRGPARSARRRPVRLVSLAAHRPAGAAALRRGRRGRGGNYAVAVPKNAPGELGHLSERFGEMAERLAEVEVMERNFLMSVSHELRTPLTAIRGHVAALLEGVVVDPELRQSSLETVELETQRLERLVGDILDLAKLDTHRFTVMTEEVDMAHLLEQAFERYRDEAQRRTSTTARTCATGR